MKKKYDSLSIYKTYEEASKWCKFWNDGNNPAPFRCVLRIKHSNKVKKYKLFFYELDF